MARAARAGDCGGEWRSEWVQVARRGETLLWARGIGQRARRHDELHLWWDDLTVKQREESEERAVYVTLKKARVAFLAVPAPARLGHLSSYVATHANTATEGDVGRKHLGGSKAARPAWLQ